jgi:hypothetical protein
MSDFIAFIDGHWTKHDVGATVRAWREAGLVPVPVEAHATSDDSAVLVQRRGKQIVAYAVLGDRTERGNWNLLLRHPGRLEIFEARHFVVTHAPYPRHIPRTRLRVVEGDEILQLLDVLNAPEWIQLTDDDLSSIARDKFDTEAQRFLASMIRGSPQLSAAWRRDEQLGRAQVPAGRVATV